MTPKRQNDQTICHQEVHGAPLEGRDSQLTRRGGAHTELAGIAWGWRGPGSHGMHLGSRQCGGSGSLVFHALGL